MLNTRRVVTISIAALASALLGSAPALAKDSYGSVNCNQTPSPLCNLGAGTDGDNGKPGTQPGHRPIDDESANGDSGLGGPQCRYVLTDYRPPTGQPQEPGGWYMVLCSPDGKDPDSHGPVWIPADGSNVTTLTPEQVAQMAREQLHLPAPTIAANPMDEQLVHLATWLWLSNGWMPVSATASVPGVSVTATATPAAVTWSMGDGSTVICAGAGTPYVAGSDPKAPSPDCGHVYRRSSASQPGQAYPVTATVHWTVTWSGAGQGGTFPDMTTTGNATFRVAESQALNNGGG